MDLNSVQVESIVRKILGEMTGNGASAAHSDKVAKVGWHTEKSAHADAPVVRELPLVFECELVSMDADTCLVVGRVVNVAADESVLTDGKPDPDKIAPIAYDPLGHTYRSMGASIASAYQERIEVQ